ncbi:MAG TPA: hypothetical protein VN937_23070 [Blastocatellia bacterium]|nr:hypothetical protein [Blastocatellia bacterium]
MSQCKLFLATGLLIVAGCSTRPVTYVTVREAKFRTEVNSRDRLKLPLSVEARERLLRFFKAGGDTDRIGREIADPDAERRYAALLDKLSDPVNLSLEDLTEKQTFKNWFSKPPIRQVVDAREEAPPAIDPVAVTDDKYWWIFYHHQKKLVELLVVKAIPPRMKR